MYELIYLYDKEVVLLGPTQALIWNEYVFNDKLVFRWTIIIVYIQALS